MKATTHPLYRKYTFILESYKNQNTPKYQWAQGLELAFDNFWDFAEHIETTIGLAPTPDHRLSRTNQELGWIPGNFCWRTGSELVTTTWGIKLPVRKNSKKTVTIREIIQKFDISHDMVYNRIHKKNYSFKDFKKEFGHA
jgi:hypothetical protein